jgi:hypothetical protein
VLGIVVGGFSRAVTNEKGAQTSTETIDVLIQVDTLIAELNAHSIPFAPAASRCEASGSRAGIDGIAMSGRDPLLTGGVLIALAMGGVAVALTTTRRGRGVMRAATDSVSRRLSRKDAASPIKGAPAKDRTPPRADPGARALDARAPEPHAPEARQGVAVLYGLSGEYDGVELELGGEPIAMGRDPRVSHLVFSSDASTVSGRHCAVWFDRDTRAAMVEDYWSTNGTYLSDGRRLAGGAPQALRSSEQFYLGDPSVLFEVRY